MADDPSSESTWRWIVGSLAGFTAALILWVLKQFADREERASKARDTYTEKLEGLPARIDALRERIERAENDLREARSHIEEIHGLIRAKAKP